MMIGLTRKLFVVLPVYFFLLNSSIASDAKCEPEEKAGRGFSNKEESIQGAYDFLYRQMDQFHKSLIIYDEPDYSAYYPSGFMGADAALDVDIHDSSDPCFGLASMRIDYDFNKDVRYNWAGIYFQYPDNNWGELPGRSLRNATQLSFWVRADHPTKAQFRMGGINQFPHHDPSKPHIDSLKPIWIQEGSTKPSKHPVILSITEEWKQYVVKIGGIDRRQLASVIGAFAIIIDRKEGGLKNSIYLDKITVDMSRREEPRFIQSFVEQNYMPLGGDIHAVNTAHTYDQALAMLAFMAWPTEENLKRAKLIADALVTVQKSDPCFNDGRLRNGYASGDLTSPAKRGRKQNSGCKINEVDRIIRLPGVWDKNESMYKEDAYSVGSDVGNMAWAGIALVQAHEILQKTTERKHNKYLESARKIGHWIISKHRIDQDDEYGGFRGGRDYQCNSFGRCYFVDSEWRSTEHNIDLFVLFSHLSKQDSAQRSKWKRNANHALSFVNKMWNNQHGYYHTGTSIKDSLFTRKKAVKNTNIIPIDAQTWAALALLKKINDSRYEYLGSRNLEKALDWALSNCGDTQYGSGLYKSINGYDFNCQDDADGAWWEGTAQLAAALNLFGNKKTVAESTLSKVRQVQIVNYGKAYGAIPAANSEKLTTGIDKWWGKWTYPNNPHVGATAWYLFAALNKNPYHLLE